MAFRRSFDQHRSAWRKAFDKARANKLETHRPKEGNVDARGAAVTAAEQRGGEGKVPPRVPSEERR